MMQRVRKDATTSITIREYTDADWSLIWPIFQEVVAARDTYVYDPEWTSDEARNVWVDLPPGQTIVACDGPRVLGTAKIGPNRHGPGSHIATASFMVASDARGRGIGRALGEYALSWARDHGYAAMQFNAVVESNLAAVKLWQALGFQIIGTVPEAFEHAQLGRVGLHIMYKPL
ncbi:MAG TPA: GNAT family N-acetyltransferase [Pyrinomonadaceae bacterium]|nr:GNAT family N-acetyltransferase [Pyrinomonadaceae bacterium]